MSSKGSASVLEWTSDSDNDLFNLSSPSPSTSSVPTHAVTSMFSSPFSAVDSTPAVRPCHDMRQAELARQFDIDFGQWFDDVDCAGVVVTQAQAPTSVDGASTGASSAGIFNSAPHGFSASTISTAPTPATAGDDAPVPPTHEHPAELNALIERMCAQIADLNTSVCERTTVGMLDTRQLRPPHYVTPVAPASARDVVASEDEDEDDDVPELLALDTSITSSGAEDSSMSTVVPSATAITDTPAAISFFDPLGSSPPQSAQAPLISIAGYFKRKAGERGAPLVDAELSDHWSEHRHNPMHDHTQAPAATLVAAEIAGEKGDIEEENEGQEESRSAATPRSALSYFSRSASPSPPSRTPSSAGSAFSFSAHHTYIPPRVDTDSERSASPLDAPGSVRCSPSPSPRSMVCSSPASSAIGAVDIMSNNNAVSAARPAHELFDIYSPSPSPEPLPSPSMSKVTSHGRLGASAGDSFSSAAGPMPVLGAAGVRNASTTTGAPQRHAAYTYPPVLPSWLPQPPELELRDALRPSPSPSHSTFSATLPPPAPRYLPELDSLYGNRNDDDVYLSSFQAWYNKKNQSHVGLTPRSALVPPSPRAFARAAASVGIPPPPAAPALAGNGSAGTTTAAAVRPWPRPPLPAVPMSVPASQFMASVVGVGGSTEAAGMGEQQTHTPFVSYTEALPSTWAGPTVRVASPNLPASSDASTPPPVRARAANAHADTDMKTTNSSASNTSASTYSRWGLGKPPTQPVCEAGWWRSWGYSAASDDVPPIPPPAPARVEPFIPSPSPTPAPWGTGTPALPVHPGMGPPYGSWPHCAYTRSPFELERERKFRFAPPARSWSWDRYAPPPPPFLTPPAPPAFYAPPMPPVRSPPGMGPGPGMGMGMGAGMWTPPEECYMHSSSAPVIPPAGPPSAACYTTVAKYAFADATVVFLVETFLYKVHRHFFERHSQHFVRLLRTYVFDGARHIFLPGVKKADFECLLSVFYPADLTTPDITSLAGWIAVLTLAQRYTMAQPRALALSQIGTLASPMEKIQIARTHSLSPRPVWLLPAYKAVCAAGAPPARHELAGLDALDMWGIWMVQHELAQGGRGREVYEEREKRVERLVRERFGPFELVADGRGNEFVH